MLERAEYLVQLSKTRDLSEMETDRVLLSAVERELMVLCEAMFLLNDYDPETAARVPDARKIIATRHKLVHGYSTIQPTVLQTIVLTDVPTLIEPLKQLIAEGPIAGASE